jgi:hypothetical protein
MERRISLSKHPRSPEDVLAQKWRRLPKDLLRSYLVRILTIELHTYPATSAKSRRRPSNPHMRFRLRRRRHEVIDRFVSSGGKVSSLVVRQNLPHGKRWPGVVGLVETRGFEHEFIP